MGRRRMGGGVACLLALGAVLARPSPSDAQAAEEDPEQLETDARTNFLAAREAYQEGRFEDALVGFTIAHELSARTGLLYNIGLTHERLRNDREALDAFSAYLEATPDSPHRASLERRMEILRRSLADAADEDAIAGSAEEDAQRPIRDVSTSEPTGRALPRFGIALGAGAVLSAAMTGVTWALANASHDDLAAGCGATVRCTPSEVEESGGPRRVRATTAMWVVTGALAAGAALALVFELRGPADEERTLSVSPTGLQLRGTF